MISKIKSPAFQPTQNMGSTPKSGSDKTLTIGLLLLGGFLLYKFVIKPEMEKQIRLKNDNETDGQVE
jgi:hypothetical protein